MLTALRDAAELVRLPAACTVPGDVLAGAAATGFPHGRRTAWLPVASVFLYCGGMALNDWADRATDAVERPERPVPSGRIGPGRALGLAGALTCAGLAAALAGGGRDTLIPAAAVAATAWTYDLVLKRTAAGPFGMAAARALNVLVGAGAGGARQASSQAAAVGAHTLALTALSRGEVHGTGIAAPAAALAVSAALAAALASGGGFPAGPARGGSAKGGRASGGGFSAGPAARGSAKGGRASGASARRGIDCGGSRATATLAVALAGAHAAAVAPGYLRAARSRAPAAVRQAVGRGVLGLIPLQAALLARAGAGRASLAVASLYLVGRPAARRVATT
ncbi:SCO3242 family prenyltransferase [Actinoallomurus rhizosphaericola]|uniref:SCO3242 family prenyltransferase n=1 Tax=Actinoallomurus rhizosphaericola TaxID=2952536 RepID=UPI0020912C06|nr:UbiA family prenyltransferase [Actinoallomurus rhizosphaericola]MCO5993710.1 UbiA family prenyltransferase [Actinoallomurus rhizosphaericola]